MVISQFSQLPITFAYAHLELAHFPNGAPVATSSIYPSAYLSVGLDFYKSREIK